MAARPEALIPRMFRDEAAVAAVFGATKRMAGLSLILAARKEV